MAKKKKIPDGVLPLPNSGSGMLTFTRATIADYANVIKESKADETWALPLKSMPELPTDPLVYVSNCPSNLEQLKARAIPIHYVRFHQPIPPGVHKEPVSEFRLLAKNQADQKYIVDSMLYVPGECLIWKAFGEENTVSDPNIIYTRLVVT